MLKQNLYGRTGTKTDPKRPLLIETALPELGGTFCLAFHAWVRGVGGLK